MNKSQELAIMQIRAKKNVQELLEQHAQAWHGEEAVVVEEEEDGDNR